MGVGMRDDTTKKTTSHRLARLEDLTELQVAEGNPDPRGWDVESADGRKVGMVDSLIADPDAMKVRYLDVELDKNALRLDEERHVLIPIGGAALDEKDDTVYLRTFPSTLRTLPPYDHGRLTRVDEELVRQYFDFQYTPSARETDFYAHAHFDERRFLGRRRRSVENATYLTRV